MNHRRVNYQRVALFFIGISVLISFLLYASQDPNKEYQNCILENVKGNVDRYVAFLIKQTCKEKYLPESFKKESSQEQSSIDPLIKEKLKEKYMDLLSRGYTEEQASYLSGGYTPVIKVITAEPEGPNRSYLGNLGASIYQGAVSNLAGQAKFFGADETAAYFQNLAFEVKQDSEFVQIQKRFSEVKSVTEGLVILLKHPKFSSLLGAQVLGQFAPALVTLIVGKTTAGFMGATPGVAGAVGYGAASLQAGTSSSGNEELNILYEKTGTTDVEVAKKLLKENPQLADAIQTVANRRGAMDGLATLLGIGASGKFAAKIGVSPWSVKGSLSESFGQAFIGAGSESVAQAITLRGRPSDIAAEIFFEGVSAPAEATMYRIINGTAPMIYNDIQEKLITFK
jgi:hypothetical protein